MKLNQPINSGLKAMPPRPLVWGAGGIANFKLPILSFPSGRSRAGVALVATLIMLSLVTFMVVAFLGVARRERRAIESAASQNESAVARDTAFSLAQADAVARLMLTGDKWGYGVMVPTNFENTFFVPGLANPTNVNSALANQAYFANPANLNNFFLQNLANLQFLPRVPVFSPYFNLTNAFTLTNVPPYTFAAPVFSETNLGRFYLDFNRNGLFDPTDRSRAGDPHWIGLLENPQLPHGPANRFVGRYTYLVAPVGKTLDLNFIHNQAKRLATVATEGYLRNLGTGPQEFNLAALLTEASPAFWAYAYNTAAAVSGTGAGNDAFTNALRLLLYRNDDSYNNPATIGTAFQPVPPVIPSPATHLTNGLMDLFVNGPLMNSTNLLFDGGNPTNVAWPGGSNAFATARRFHDFTELFSASRTNYTRFTTNLRYLSTNVANSMPGDADRRLPYRLMEVLGTDSWPVTNKLNLNWPNTLAGSAGGETFGFTNWHPDVFFYSAAELMLRASFTPSVFVNTNWTGFGGADPNVLVTNFYFGTTFLGTNVDVNSLSLTNIPIFPFSYYSPEVHRILQFAANLYDANGPPEWLTNQNYTVGTRVQRGGIHYICINPNVGSMPPSTDWDGTLPGPLLPTVWRPIFGFGNTNAWPSNDFIRIIGYTTNGTDPANLLSLPEVDLTDPNSRMAMYNTATGLGSSNLCLVAGTPVILGARKGYPNFNEFGVQSIFSLTRRLEFAKTAATNAGPMAPGAAARPVETNQSLIIGLTNIYGFEAWNSYAAAFPRRLQLVATNIAKIVITNEFGPIYTNIVTNGISQAYGAGLWQGTANGYAAFKSFFFTNVPQLSTNAALGYAYATNYPPLAGFTNGGFIPASPSGPGSPSIFNRSNGFPEMRLGITITNSIRYALIDSLQHVVDFVTLTNLVAGMDLATALRVTNSPADTGVRFWFTNRLAPAPFGGTIGITNQIDIATNYLATTTNQWRNWSLTAPVAREIDRFRRWMGLTGVPGMNPVQSLNTNITRIQSPFTPTRVIAFGATWEVNDPLVHYTTRELSDPFRTSTGDQVTPIIPPIAAPPPPGTLYRVDLGLVNGRLSYVTNGGINRFYNPWGRMLDPTGTRLASLPNFYSVAPAPYDQRLKDPGIYSSDQWDFPQRKFANLGWIGRVHRGTPWQTVYLKSDIPNPTNWFYWARSVETNPTNDWRLVDVFSAAISAETTRSLLSVNQTNGAAWAAALGGTIALSNNGVAITPFVVTPATLQMTNMVGGLTNGLINAKFRVPQWHPVVNYSAGDVVAYQTALGGNALYPSTAYFIAINGTNQNQNPLGTNFFNYWTNLHAWSNSVSYSFNDLVQVAGVAFRAIQTPNNNYYPPDNPGFWEPYPHRPFTHVGRVLSTPELSVQSPYLNGGRTWQFGTAYGTGARVHWLGWYYQATRPVPINTPPNPHLNYSDARTLAQTYWWPLESPAIARNAGTRDAINDVFVERIPQQTLGLMQVEPFPRFKIYTWGQSLRPAERGVHVAGGPYQLMVTNYQITGESAAVATLRIEGLPEPGQLPRPLPAGAPPVVQPRVVIEDFKLTPGDN